MMENKVTLKKSISFLSIFLFSCMANADESWHLNIHTVSHHFSERSNGNSWNEKNYGIGIRYEISELLSFQGGFYRNSIFKWTTYGIAEISPIRYQSWSLGAFGGWRTNYEKPFMGSAGALLRWQHNNFTITLRALPKIGTKHAGFTSLELGYKFK